MNEPKRPIAPQIRIVCSACDRDYKGGKPSCYCRIEYGIFVGLLVVVLLALCVAPFFR